MIYTAPCVMFLMSADTVRGQVGGGWALEIESFSGPVKCHRADRRVPFGAQKTRNVKMLLFFRGPRMVLAILKNTLEPEQRACRNQEFTQ